MTKNKTIPNELSVDDFLNDIDDSQKKEDMHSLLSMMKKITNKEAKMWGESIVGFDQYHYVYESGREGDMFLTGCSPRKNNISIYVVTGFDKYKSQLKKLGKHKVGKSCLYIKSLQDIDQDILKEIVVDSVERMKKKYK